MPHLDEKIDQILNEFNRLDNFMETFRRLSTIKFQHSRKIYHILLLAKLSKQGIIRDSNLTEFLGRVYASTNRPLIRTRYGYIGLAPRFVRQNDLIALMKGAEPPFILRPSGRCWKLVGESYINGIMYGEAFNEKDCRFYG